MRAPFYLLAFIFTNLAWSQTAPARPEFEVASIRLSGPMVPGQLGIGVHIDGAQVTARLFTLKAYLGYAYGLKPYQITGPDWITSDRYDITAKIPHGVSMQRVPDMMQTLLEQRFQMKMHRDKRSFPVYALVVAKSGLKMRPLPPDPDDAADASKNTPDVAVGGGRGGLSVNFGHGSSISLGGNQIVGKKVSMPSLADWLSRFEDRPVVDMSEVKGKYDLALQFTPDDYRAMLIRAASAGGVNIMALEASRPQDDSSTAGLQAALQTLGLRVEPRKSLIDILIVDHAEKTPTAN
jgi:uncharacterized protein (TIGR03435 family)